MTHQQRLHEERESERQRVEAAQAKPNSIRVTRTDAFVGVNACDNSGRRVYVTLDRREVLSHVDDLLGCLDIADIQHVMARAIERQRILIREGLPLREADDVTRGAQ
jgi:hypothetical protein